MQLLNQSDVSGVTPTYVGKGPLDDATTTLRWARAELSNIRVELSRLDTMLYSAQHLLEQAASAGESLRVVKSRPEAT